MWTDNRYFENQFASWEDITKLKEKKDDEKKESELDDLMLISSLVSTKESGIDNIFNYTLNNIIRLFNKYTLKYLNSQQELFSSAPSKNRQVDGTIYVGIHGISVLFLRILLLIDSNNLNDEYIEEHIKQQNDLKDSKIGNTPFNDNDDDDDKEDKEENKECLLSSDIYVTSNDLLIKFIHDLCIGLRCKTINELRRKLLTRIVEFVEFILNPSIKYRNHWDSTITLVLGKPGIISIAIIVFYITKNYKEYNKYIRELINIADKVIQNTAYELLYGQIGYISCIQFIQSFIDNPCYKDKKGINDNNDLLSHPKIINIINHTLSVGQQIVERENIKNAPLMWEFHGIKYLCSAHGYIGIIYTLLQMRNPIIIKYCKLINKSILYLISIKYDSGNYPSEYSSINNPRCSHLVQWCHGSPSYVTLFAKYYKIFGIPMENKQNDDDDDNNKEYINKCIIAMDNGCQHIWKYGLLTKGRSICHGVAGNAYSFLITYSVLNKYGNNNNILKYLYYAFQFASFMSHPQTSFFREPDNEDSLFEGVAGQCCFTMDLMFNYNDPKFPCYDF